MCGFVIYSIISPSCISTRLASSRTTIAASRLKLLTDWYKGILKRLLTVTAGPNVSIRSCIAIVFRPCGSGSFRTLAVNDHNHHNRYEHEPIALLDRPVRNSSQYEPFGERRRSKESCLSSDSIPTHNDHALLQDHRSPDTRILSGLW